MRRGRRKRASTRPVRVSDRTPAILGAALTVIALAGFGVLVWFNLTLRGAAEVDPDSLCPKVGPTMVLAVLVDATDTLSSHQRVVIAGRLRERILGLPDGALVLLALVTPEPDAEPAILFRRCKPRDGGDASEIHENPRLIQERFTTGFVRPLETALAALVNTSESSSSPIMESLQGVVVNAFPFGSRTGNSELLVISDLLQHSEAFSFYRSEDWGAFSRSQAFDRLSRNLANVDVVLYQLPRPGAVPLEAKAILEFWANYFDVQGARSVRREILGDL